MNSETSPFTQPPDDVTATQRELPVLRSPMPDIPGHEVLDLIGRGGMGKVYRARQVALGRIVAVKLLAHEPDDKSLSRFREEYRAVARLQHPNIAQLFESGTAEGRPYFTQEYIEGGTLANRYEGVPQEPLEAARMVVTIARAIQYSHEQGILHRDLKPGNILLTGRGEPKVTDFGLAKDLAGNKSDTPMESGGGLTRTGEILGTPSYMPPEQASGVVSGIGPTADVYSLGAILYEALTGRPPFQGPDPLQTLFMVLSMDPVAPRALLPKLPRDIETICLKCLEKSPKKRYATAGELADDLQRFLQGKPILARPVGRWEKARKWAVRNKAAAGLLALSAVFLVSLVAFTIAQVVQNRRVESANNELTHSNTQLLLTKNDLSESNRNLTRANAESDRSFTLAQSALDDIVRDLGLKLHGVPKAEGALLDTLRKSAALYRQLSDARPDDAGTAERYAASLTLLSANETAFGEFAAAKKTLAQLDAFLNQALEKHLDNEVLLTQRVRLAHDQMTTAQNENPPTNAPAARTRFATLVDDYARRFPAKPESRTFTVQKFIALSMEASANGRSEDQIAALQQAVAEARKYVEAFPKLSSGYLFMGTSLDALGNAYLGSKDDANAEKTFRELEQYYLLAANVNLDEGIRQGGIARARLMLADLAYNRGKFQQAFDLYKTSEGMFRKLAENFPKIAMHRVHLAYALFWGGVMQKDVDRATCLKQIDEAITVLEGVVATDPAHARTLETYRQGRKDLTP